MDDISSATDGSVSAGDSTSQGSSTEVTVTPESTDTMGLDTTTTTGATAEGGGETDSVSTGVDPQWDCEVYGCSDPGEQCVAGECFYCIGTAFKGEDGALVCCESSPTAIEIDKSLEAVPVLMGVLIDGVEPEPSAYGSAEISLEGPLGDRVVVGKTGEPLLAMALRGTYKLVYEAGAVASKMPQNRRFVLGEVVVGKDEPIVAQITTVRLKGSVEIDGKAPIVSAYDTAEVLLYDAASGGATRLLQTQASDGSFDLRVVKDAALSNGQARYASYEAMYRSVKPGPKLPRNHDVLLDAKVAVMGADVTVQQLDVKVATVAVTGSMTVDGSAPPKSAYDRAAIFLVDTQSGDQIKIGDSVNGVLDSFSLIQGRSYEVFYAGPKEGVLMPRDEWAKVGMVLMPKDQAAEITVAITSAQVEATVTLDDAPPPSSPMNKGTLALQRAGARAPLGALVDGVAKARVLALEPAEVGDLGLVYGHESTDGALPANTRALALLPQEEALEKVISLAAELRSSLVSGVVLINDEPGPVSAYDSGRVLLRGANGDQVLLGRTRDPSFSRRVLYGEYEVCYAVESAGATTPRNGDVCFDSLTVDQDTLEVKINVPRVTVSISGAQRFGKGPNDRGQIFLRHALSGDEIFVGTTDLPELSAPVVPGPYWLVYRVDHSLKDAPRNQNARLSCHDLSAATP